MVKANHKCGECGTERYVSPYKLRRGGSSLLCGSCSVKSRTGKLNPWYKGGEHINTQGYREILLTRNDFFFGMTTGRNYVREHRLIMAKSLGRLLHPWESVHHKNGDKLDNCLENLELTTKNQHMRDHNNGYRDGFDKGLLDGRKEALKKVVEWGEGECPHISVMRHRGKPGHQRHECDVCQQALKKEIE